MNPTTEEKKPEVKKIDWTKTAEILKSLEVRKFHGSVEIKMEAGEPKFAHILEKVKL